MTEPLGVFVGADAALSYEDNVARDLFMQLDAVMEIGLERVEIPIVDPHQFRP